ncbi:MAG: glycosyltransferase family 2 protein [Dehalococcoidales bacterium]|nr:glycosyltransferase family 2 protein [Dehalococcoidales bacterium]
MYKKYAIGIVVLCYDVEPFISGVIEELPEFVDRIYVIDDCSKDNTYQVVSGLKNPKVALIRHETNLGPGAGLRTGYKAALADGTDIVIKIDGDGQMPVEQIEDMISPIMEKKADYIKGNRLQSDPGRHGMPRFRMVGNHLLTWLTRIESGYWHISDSQNGFTAISREALAAIDLDFCSYYGYLNDILARLNIYNFKVLDISMPAKYGKEKSKIKYARFIPRVSLILLRIFLWRLRVKYLRFPSGKNNRMIGEQRIAKGQD